MKFQPLFLLLLVPTFAAAEVVKMEIPGFGSHPFDLGGPVGRVISATLTLQGEAQSRLYSCWHRDYHFYRWEPNDFRVFLVDQGFPGYPPSAETFLQGSEPTPFDLTLRIGGIPDSEEFLSDGTGTLEVFQVWDLDLPSGTECGYQPEDSGFVDFQGPLIFTLEFEDLVPNTVRTWGAVKSRYH